MKDKRRPTNGMEASRCGADGRLRASLAVAAAALITAPAAAHERWVRHELLRPFDHSYFDKLGWTNGLTAVGLILSILWFSTARRRHAGSGAGSGAGSRSGILAPLEPWMPTLLRICYGATLIVFALQGMYLAPDLAAAATLESRLLVALAGATGVLLLAGYRVRSVAMLSLFIFAWAAVRRPFESYESTPITSVNVLCYAEVVGIALYLFLRGSGRVGLDGAITAWRTGEASPLAKRRSVASTRIALGGTLMLLGLLKFTNPALFMGVVQNYPEVFHEPFRQAFGASQETVVFGASMTELTLGLYLVCGFWTRAVAVLLGAIFAATAFAFREEVIGHLPLVGMVLVLAVERGGRAGPEITAGAGLNPAPRVPRRPALAAIRAMAATTLGLAAFLGFASFQMAHAEDHVSDVAHDSIEAHGALADLTVPATESSAAAGRDHQ